MTYEEIFGKTKKTLTDGDITGFKGDFAVQINIIGEGEGAFYIAYKNNSLDIAPYEYNDRDACLIVSAQDFLKIADGSLNAVTAFMSGRLKVEGSVEKSLELQKMIETIKKNSK